MTVSLSPLHIKLGGKTTSGCLMGDRGPADAPTPHSRAHVQSEGRRGIGRKLKCPPAALGALRHLFNKRALLWSCAAYGVRTHMLLSGRKWEWKKSVCGGIPSNIPGFHLLDVSSSPIPAVTTKMSSDTTRCPWGATRAPGESYSFEVTATTNLQIQIQILLGIFQMK